MCYYTNKRTGGILEVVKFNKLVRDKIPEIIEKNGQTAHIKILSEEEYRNALDLVRNYF